MHLTFNWISWRVNIIRYRYRNNTATIGAILTSSISITPTDNSILKNYWEHPAFILQEKPSYSAVACCISNWLYWHFIKLVVLRQTVNETNLVSWNRTYIGMLARRLWEEPGQTPQLLKAWYFRGFYWADVFMSETPVVVVFLLFCAVSSEDYWLKKYITCFRCINISTGLLGAQEIFTTWIVNQPTENNGQTTRSKT